MEGFKEGYSYFAKNAGVLSAAFKAAIDGEKGAIHNDFIAKANAEIDSLVKILNSTFKGHKTPTAQLKGNVAEYVHASSFNVNASLNHSLSSAEVLKSNKYGSVDIQVTYCFSKPLRYLTNDLNLHLHQFDTEVHNNPHVGLRQPGTEAGSRE